MKYTIKKQDIAIITNGMVEKSFDNEDCYLHAVIRVVSDDVVNRKRTYEVRTDLAKYEEKKIYEFDENQNDLLDENGERVFTILKTLIAVEQKQDWSKHTFSYDEIDDLSEQISSLIPSDLTKTEKEILELKTMFLYKRKEEKPWSVNEDEWRLRTDLDFQN